MGNTAKFMLVGILVLVIVIAVIWDRQSDDLKQMAAFSQRDVRRPAGTGKLRPILSVTEPRVNGVLEGRPLTAQEKAAVQELRNVKEQFQQSQEPTVAASAPLPAQSADAVQRPESPSAPPVPKARYYTVQKYETLWDIAHKVYGSALSWKPLWEANKEICPDPKMLKPGQRIVLPELKKKAAVRRPATGGTAPARGGPQHYIVRKGDYLGKISQRFYGTWKEWRRILDANNLESAKSLREGMELVIPLDTGRRNR